METYIILFTEFILLAIVMNCSNRIKKVETNIKIINLEKQIKNKYGTEKP